MVSSFHKGGVLGGIGGGFVSRKGLNEGLAGSCGYIGLGAVGLTLSASNVFSVRFVPSLLSRHQLASKLED